MNWFVIIVAALEMGRFIATRRGRSMGRKPVTKALQEYAADL